MAEIVILPKLGNSVESCILLGWKVAIGEKISLGTALCEAETDKTTVEVESTAEGILLHQFFQEDDEVEVFAPIAIVGEVGEDITALLAEQSGDNPEKETTNSSTTEKPVEINKEKESVTAAIQQPPKEDSETEHTATQNSSVGISPRARNSASQRSVPTTVLQGSGPNGRVIERDVLEYINTHEPLTPAARDKLNGTIPPAVGSGVGGRVTAKDLSVTPSQNQPVEREDVVEIPVKGVRKIIAQRMHSSIQTTAQLTLHSYADARYIQELRKRCKTLPAGHPMAGVSINDMILFAVIRTLQEFPYMNAHFLQDTIAQYGHIHLGFAVDTQKGLMVPVINQAEQLPLEEISTQTKSLGSACKSGTINPDRLQGGTFTVTNLGTLGIEHFTPVLNTPEVGILGVGAISLRPIQRGSRVVHIPHIALSLTIDHQAIDGAPAGRFLQALTENIKNFDMLFMTKSISHGKEK